MKSTKASYGEGFTFFNLSVSECEPQYQLPNTRTKFNQTWYLNGALITCLPLVRGSGCVSPTAVGQISVNMLPRQQRTLGSVVSMRSVSYQKKAGYLFFPELLVHFVIVLPVTVLRNGIASIKLTWIQKHYSALWNALYSREWSSIVKLAVDSNVLHKR
jgi:hypothetical protein